MSKSILLAVISGFFGFVDSALAEPLGDSVGLAVEKAADGSVERWLWELGHLEQEVFTDHPPLESLQRVETAAASLDKDLREIERLTKKNLDPYRWRLRYLQHKQLIKMIDFKLTGNFPFQDIGKDMKRLANLMTSNFPGRQVELVEDLERRFQKIRLREVQEALVALSRANTLDLDEQKRQLKRVRKLLTEAGIDQSEALEKIRAFHALPKTKFTRTLRGTLKSGLILDGALSLSDLVPDADAGQDFCRTDGGMSDACLLQIGDDLRRQRAALDRPTDYKFPQQY